MDNPTIESVKKVFGTQFQKFCSDRNIVLTENACGAFMVPDVPALKQCLAFLNKDRKKFDSQLKKIQNSCVSYVTDKDNAQELRKQYKVASNRKQKSCQNTIYSPANILLTNLSLKIYLYDTSSVLSCHKFQKMPLKCILDTAKSGEEIYKNIINTPINNAITDYKFSIPSISLLLEKFQKQHKKFHYFSILMHLISKQEGTQNSKCKYAIDEKQMKQFFNLVFFKVIPLSIFGKLQNQKKIKKALFHLLKVPCFKPLDLKLYINKLDVSSIKWLQNIKNSYIGWLLIAKFVKWLFTEFLVKILHMYFHITTMSNTSNERVYIVRSEWNKVQKQFLRREIRSETLQLDLTYKYWKPPIGIFKLQPKYTTVRPIFVLGKIKNNDKKDLQTLHKFLKQLHITKYGLNNFEEKWKSIVQRKYNLKDKKLYFVSCDVIDAFGSIVQGKLFDIIRTLCEKLPNIIVFRNYMVKSKRRKNNIVCYKQFVCDSQLLLPLSPGELYVRTNRTEQKAKSWLLERIWKYINYRTVQIGKENYIVAKGIVQGSMISPILADIYFDFAIEKEMTLFLKSGNIIRYVDDILFVTEDEESAKQFLRVITEGIPKYNCRFKKEKLQTNVACTGNTITDHIIYIGYKINCNTLEIEPNTQSIDSRYSVFPCTKNISKPLDILRFRLYNISILKLSKIVIDNRINTKTTIKKILRKAGLMQANRACVLINELFGDIQNNWKRIFEIIRSSNRKIARYVIRTFLKYEGIVTKSYIQTWNNEILSILWESYERVFIRDTMLRTYFLKFWRK